MNIEKLQLLVQKYLEINGQLLICISGMSGSGKSYIAEQLSNLLNIKHIDQDTFYIHPSKMPKVRLSDGKSYTNWDSEDSINLKLMNNEIDKYIKKGIIFSGFSCRNGWFDHSINVQIHLEITKETSYQRRYEQGKNQKHGAIIVNEMVYPFYLETLEQSKIDYTIDTNTKSSTTLDRVIEYLIYKLT